MRGFRVFYENSESQRKPQIDKKNRQNSDFQNYNSLTPRRPFGGRFVFCFEDLYPAKAKRDALNKEHPKSPTLQIPFTQTCLSSVTSVTDEMNASDVNYVNSAYSHPSVSSQLAQGSTTDFVPKRKLRYYPTLWTQHPFQS